ncbi:MAG TPA: hypothetical protein VH637_20280 [Streptosporangiaceae bacterium]
MHPEIRQQLAAARISDMIAEAEGWRLARQACLARRSRTSPPMTPPGPPLTPPGPPRTQADTERPTASTAPAGAGRVPATTAGRADAELAR